MRTRMHMCSWVLQQVPIVWLLGCCSYQQHEEHKEDEGDEVNGTQDPVGLLDTSKVKVSKDNPKLCKSLMRRKKTLENVQLFIYIHDNPGLLIMSLAAEGICS